MYNDIDDWLTDARMKKVDTLFDDTFVDTFDDTFGDTFNDLLQALIFQPPQNIFLLTGGLGKFPTFFKTFP